MKSKSKSFQVRFLALALAISMGVPNTLKAQMAPELSTPTLSLKLPSIEKVIIPESIGSIQEVYSSETQDRRLKTEETTAGKNLSPVFRPPSPVVILIQDAHAIYDAQNNIQKIIQFFQAHYGIDLVALEGAQGKLDSTLLRAFPDAFVKEKIMKDYLLKGELNGAEMSAVLGDPKGRYYGIEDWNLYEENYLAYLQAVQNKEEILKRLTSAKESLDQERELVFSPRLLDFYEHLEKFESENAYLAELLQYLKSISNEQRATSNEYPHLQKLFLSLEFEKESVKNQTDNESSARKIAEHFRTRFVQKMNAGEQKNFHQNYQAFVTGEKDAGSFLKSLVEIGSKHHLKIKLPPALLKLIVHHETMASIKGTKLFEELENLLREIENGLIANPREREITEKYHQLKLLKALAKLELTKSQWGEVKKLKGSKVQKFEANSTDNLLTLKHLNFSTHFAFYELAEQRDQVFIWNLTKLFAKEKAKAALVLTGGFHTQGFERSLQEAGISYVVVSPQIESLEGQDTYPRVMQGNLSYKQYLQTTFYDAFMKHASLQLAGKLERPALRKNLKVWRDEIIRHLSSEGRISEAARYTRYIDFVLKEYAGKLQTDSFPKSKEELIQTIEKELDHFRQDTMKDSWQRFQFQLNEFTAGLKSLLDKKQLDLKNVSALLDQVGQIKTASLVSARPLDPGASAGFLLPYLQQVAERQSRSVREKSGERPDSQYGPGLPGRAEVRSGTALRSEEERRENPETEKLANMISGRLLSSVLHAEGNGQASEEADQQAAKRLLEALSFKKQPIAAEVMQAAHLLSALIDAIAMGFPDEIQEAYENLTGVLLGLEDIPRVKLAKKQIGAIRGLGRRITKALNAAFKIHDDLNGFEINEARINLKDFLENLNQPENPHAWLTKHFNDEIWYLSEDLLKLRKYAPKLASETNLSVENELRDAGKLLTSRLEHKPVLLQPTTADSTIPFDPKLAEPFRAEQEKENVDEMILQYLERLSLRELIQYWQDLSDGKIPIDEILARYNEVVKTYRIENGKGAYEDINLTEFLNTTRMWEDLFKNKLTSSFGFFQLGMVLPEIAENTKDVMILYYLKEQIERVVSLIAEKYAAEFLGNGKLSMNGAGAIAEEKIQVSFTEEQVLVKIADKSYAAILPKEYFAFSSAESQKRVSEALKKIIKNKIDKQISISQGTNARSEVRSTDMDEKTIKLDKQPTYEELKQALTRILDLRIDRRRQAPRFRGFFYQEYSLLVHGKIETFKLLSDELKPEGRLSRLPEAEKKLVAPFLNSVVIDSVFDNLNDYILPEAAESVLKKIISQLNTGQGATFLPGLMKTKLNPDEKFKLVLKGFQFGDTYKTHKTESLRSVILNEKDVKKLAGVDFHLEPGAIFLYYEPPGQPGVIRRTTRGRMLDSLVSEQMSRIFLYERRKSEHEEQLSQIKNLLEEARRIMKPVDFQRRILNAENIPVPHLEYWIAYARNNRSELRKEALGEAMTLRGPPQGQARSELRSQILRGELPPSKPRFLDISQRLLDFSDLFESNFSGQKNQDAFLENTLQRLHALESDRRSLSRLFAGNFLATFEEAQNWLLSGHKEIPLGMVFFDTTGANEMAKQFHLDGFGDHFRNLLYAQLKNVFYGAASENTEKPVASYNGGLILLLGVTDFQLVKQLPKIISEVKQAIQSENSRYGSAIQKMDKKAKAHFEEAVNSLTISASHVNVALKPSPPRKNPFAETNSKVLNQVFQKIKNGDFENYTPGEKRAFKHWLKTITRQKDFFQYASGPMREKLSRGEIDIYTQEEFQNFEAWPLEQQNQFYLRYDDFLALRRELLAQAATYWVEEVKKDTAGAREMANEYLEDLLYDAYQKLNERELKVKNPELRKALLQTLTGKDDYSQQNIPVVTDLYARQEIVKALAASPNQGQNLIAEFYKTLRQQRLDTRPLFDFYTGRLPRPMHLYQDPERYAQAFETVLKAYRIVIQLQGGPRSKKEVGAYLKQWKELFNLLNAFPQPLPVKFQRMIEALQKISPAFWKPSQETRAVLPQVRESLETMMEEAYRNYVIKLTENFVLLYRDYRLKDVFQHAWISEILEADARGNLTALRNRLAHWFEGEKDSSRRKMIKRTQRLTQPGALIFKRFLGDEIGVLFKDKKENYWFIFFELNKGWDYYKAFRPDKRDSVMHQFLLEAVKMAQKNSEEIARIEDPHEVRQRLVSFIKELNASLIKISSRESFPVTVKVPRYGEQDEQSRVSTVIRNGRNNPIERMPAYRVRNGAGRPNFAVNSEKKVLALAEAEGEKPRWKIIPMSVEVLMTFVKRSEEPALSLTGIYTRKPLESSKVKENSKIIYSKFDEADLTVGELKKEGVLYGDDESAKAKMASSGKRSEVRPTADALGQQRTFRRQNPMVLALESSSKLDVSNLAGRSEVRSRAQELSDSLKQLGDQLRQEIAAEDVESLRKRQNLVLDWVRTSIEAATELLALTGSGETSKLEIESNEQEIPEFKLNYALVTGFRAIMDDQTNRFALQQLLQDRVAPQNLTRGVTEAFQYMTKVFEQNRNPLVLKKAALVLSEMSIEVDEILLALREILEYRDENSFLLIHPLVLLAFSNAQAFNLISKKLVKGQSPDLIRAALWALGKMSHAVEDGVEDLNQVTSTPGITSAVHEEAINLLFGIAVELPNGPSDVSVMDFLKDIYSSSTDEEQRDQAENILDAYQKIGIIVAPFRSEVRGLLENPFGGLAQLTPDKILAMYFQEKLDLSAVVDKVSSAASGNRVEIEKILKQASGQLLNRLSREIDSRDFELPGDAAKWILSDEFPGVFERITPKALKDIDSQNQLVKRIQAVVAGEIAGLVVETTQAFEKLTPEAKQLLAKASTDQLHSIYQKWLMERQNGQTILPAEFADKGHHSLLVDVSLLGSSEDQAKKAQGFFSRVLTGKDSLGLTYNIGTPDEKIALGFTRLFKQILTIGYKENKPVDFLAIKNRFANGTVILPLGTPIRANLKTALQQMNIDGVLTDSHLAEQSGVGFPEFVRLVEWMLRAEYLRKKLVVKSDVPFPILTSGVFNSLISLINDLAASKAAQAIISRAA